jgi:hypothetical protein
LCLLIHYGSVSSKICILNCRDPFHGHFA